MLGKQSIASTFILGLVLVVWLSLLHGTSLAEELVEPASAQGNRNPSVTIVLKAELPDGWSFVSAQTKNDVTTLTYSYKEAFHLPVYVASKARSVGRSVFGSSTNWVIWHGEPEPRASEAERSVVGAFLKNRLAVLVFNDVGGSDAGNVSTTSSTGGSRSDGSPGSQARDPGLSLLDPRGQGLELAPGWQYRGSRLEEGRLDLFFGTPPGPGLTVSIAQRDENQPHFALTESFRVWYSLDGAVSDEFKPALEDTLNSLVTAIRVNGDHRSAELLASKGEVSSGLDRTRPDESAIPWLVWFSAALLVLSLPGLFAAAARLVKNRVLPSRCWLIALAAVAGGFVIKFFLITPTPVMVWMMHPILQSSVTLSELPRYGATGPVLYHSLFYIFPIVSDTVLLFNMVASSLNVLLLLGLATRLFPGPAAERPVMFTLVVAVGASMIPVFLRDGASESLLVAAMMFILGGWVVLLDSFLQGTPQSSANAGVSANRWLRLASTLAPLPMLAAGATFRPELAITVPLGTFVIYWARTPRPINWKNAGLFASGLILLVPYVIFELSVLESEAYHDNLHWYLLEPQMLYKAFAFRNLWLSPMYFPIMVTVLALAGVWTLRRTGRSHGRAAIAVGVLVLLWTLVSYFDFNTESMLRLHVPPALMLLPLAAAGAVRFGRRLWAQGLILGLVVASAIPTVSGTMVRTTSQQSETILQEAVQRLPDDRDNVLVALDWEDQPLTALSPASLEAAMASEDGTANVHRNYPTWQVTPPVGRTAVIPVSRFRSDGPGEARDVYFLLSPQCYAVRESFGLEPWGVQPDPYYLMHPACRWLLTHNKVEPVFLVWLEHQPELASQFNWYPRGITGMTVGLLRVIESLDEPYAGESLGQLSDGVFASAKQLLIESRFEEAGPVFDWGLDVLRSSPAMWAHAADFYLLAGHTLKDADYLARALGLWERVYEADHDYPMLYKQFGATFQEYTKLISDEQAWAYIDGRLDQDPDNLIGLYLKGLFLFYGPRDYSESLKYLEPVLARVKTDPRVYMYIALDHFYLGRQEEAEKYVAESIKVANEQDPDAYYVRSIVYRKKDVNAAAEDIQRYLDMTQGGGKVKNEAKEQWLRNEVKAVREGRPSDWWISDPRSEPWVDQK